MTSGTLSLAIFQHDPPDNRYVECAVEGVAVSIVSGDRLFLSVGMMQSICSRLMQCWQPPSQTLM